MVLIYQIIIADIIREFLHLIGVSHTLTLAYSKQENTIVERYYKEINRHIRERESAISLSAAECLLKHFGRFGAPHQLRSDNGPHFIAEVICETPIR